MGYWCGMSALRATTSGQRPSRGDSVQYCQADVAAYRLDTPYVMIRGTEQCYSAPRAQLCHAASAVFLHGMLPARRHHPWVQPMQYTESADQRQPTAVG